MSLIRRLRGAWLHGVVVLLALMLLASAPGSVFAADTQQVVISQPSDQLAWRFDPATVTVEAGTTVTWVNQGTVSMTVTSSDGLFDSDQISPGASFSTTFDTPGTFRYFCVSYPHMKGVVVVTR